MICKNCGKENLDDTKFCESCGSTLETSKENTEDSKEQNEKDLINSTIESLEQPSASSSEQDEHVSEESDQEQIPPIPSATEVQNAAVNSEKKSSKAVVFIIMAVVLALAAAVLVFMAFNKSNSSKNSVDVFEKAIANLEQKGNNSGTVNASVMIQGQGADISLSGTIKYQKSPNEYSAELALDKSIMFDEMKAYITGSKDAVSVYLKSSVLNYLMGVTGEDKWLYYTLNLAELDFDLESIITKTDINLSDLELDKRLKYIDKDAGVSHYQFTIDKELIQKLAEKFSDEEDLEEYDLDDVDFPDNFVIDLYINDYNELQKISLDLIKLIDNEDITKALVTIEFKNFNNTVVSIPEEALKSEQTIQEYMLTAYDLDDSDFDLDDTDFDLDDTDFDLDDSDFDLDI